MRTEAGQALMELAVGMFALALVVSVLCCFAVFSAKSLKVQNALRSANPELTGQKVELGPVLGPVVDRENLRIEERIVLPETWVTK